MPLHTVSSDILGYCGAGSWEIEIVRANECSIQVINPTRRNPKADDV